MSAEMLAGLATRRFIALVRGLSPDSQFKQLVAQTPERVGADEAAALMARA